MKLSSFSKPTVKPLNPWLKPAKAAEILGVEVRTINRWLNHRQHRLALGVVRRQNQWRIPLPKSIDGDSEGAWEVLTRCRLKEIGVRLKERWQIELVKLSKQHDRYSPESYRLWLAAYMKALEQGRITQKVRENILILWQAACEVLDTQKSSKRYELDAERLKPLVAAGIRERGASIKSVMQQWPGKRHFQILRDLHTQSDFETIRRKFDFEQAYRDELRRRRGTEPAVENLRLLLHKDLLTHINDTRHDPPPGITVIRDLSPEELQILTMANVQDQIHGKQTAPVIISYRQPQPGISLRTFRARYPRNQQTRIIARVRRALPTIPGCAENPTTSKTQHQLSRPSKRVVI